MKYLCNMHKNLQSSFQKKTKKPQQLQIWKLFRKLENLISLALVESFTSVPLLLPLEL